MFDLVGVKKGTIPNSILENIKGEMTQAEIAEMIGIHRDNASSAIYKLYHGKKLERRKFNGKYYYRKTGASMVPLEAPKKKWKCKDCGTTENKVKGRSLCKSCLTDGRKNGEPQQNKLSLEWLRKPIRVAA